MMQLQCLRGFFLEILLTIKNKHISEKKLREFLDIFQNYLETIFNCCVDVEKSKMAYYKDRKNYIKDGFFGGQKVS